MGLMSEEFAVRKVIDRLKIPARINKLESLQIWTYKSVRSIDGVLPDDQGNVDINPITTTGFVPYVGATKNVNLGTKNLTTDALFVSKSAQASTGETVATFTVSDDALSYLKISNNTSQNGLFSPGIQGFSDNTTIVRSALILLGQTNVDTGALTVIAIDGRTLAGASLVNKPILEIRNFAAPKARWDANGDYSITGKMLFGAITINAASSGDTNLYRATANSLKTDDDFTANSLIKIGGTSSQFLKADGSIDSSTYLTTATAASTYVPYTGASANVDLGAHDLTVANIVLGANATIKPSAASGAYSFVENDGTTKTLTIQTAVHRIGWGVFNGSTGSPYSYSDTTTGKFVISSSVATGNILDVQDSGGNSQLSVGADGTLTTISSLSLVAPGNVTLIHNGVRTDYKQSADTDAARGTVLTTAMSAAAAGDTVIIGAGNYLVTTALVILDYQTIRFQSAQVYNTTNTADVFTATSKTGWSIEGNGRIVGQGIGSGGVYTDQTGIRVTGTKYTYKIEGVTIQDFKGCGISLQNTNTTHTGPRIASVYVTNCTNGLYVPQLSEYVKVTNSCFFANTIGIYLVGGNFHAANNSINDNTLYGVYLATGTNDLHGIFTGCALNHNGNLTTGISIYADTVINGMIFTGCDIYGGLYLKACSGIVIEGGEGYLWITMDGTIAGMNFVRNFMFSDGDKTITATAPQRAKLSMENNILGHAGLGAPSANNDLWFDHSTNTLTTTTFVGALTGAVTGNASSATKLATARAINGVDFDGTAPITVTADANTLSGTTLKSTILASSLTSVGTLATLTVTAVITGSVSGNAATVTTNANLTGVITSAGNATSIASQTGTGTKFVVDTSPVLVTPNIGVATATSVNKVAITAPTTSATLVIADTKTFTVNNSITLATNEHSYMEAGVYLKELTAAKLIIGWQTVPANGAVESDLSGLGHNATYSADWVSTDQVTKGLTWTISPNGTTDYLEFADSDDFSFGNGTNDSNFSIGGWFEILSDSAERCFISKWDSTAGSELREWVFDNTSGSTRKLRLYVYDESANAVAYRTQDTASAAGWHFVVLVYDTAGGTGATFMNGLTMYVDGVVVASTATNNTNYVAMENLATVVRIGAYGGVASSFGKGDYGKLFITKEALTAAWCWRVFTETRGFYNL